MGKRVAEDVAVGARATMKTNRVGLDISPEAGVEIAEVVVVLAGPHRNTGPGKRKLNAIDQAAPLVRVGYEAGSRRLLEPGRLGLALALVGKSTTARRTKECLPAESEFSVKFQLPIDTSSLLDQRRPRPF